MTRRFPRWLLEPTLALLIAALWLIKFIPELDGFAFWRGAQYSDLLISHWPNAFFLRQSLIKWGQIPLWNPQILSGAPFAADPLSGMWYPPNWLALVIPISLAFNLLYWFHLAWAGWGIWRFVRAEGGGLAGGVIAALAFSGTPKLMTHIGVGHLSLVCAVSWTPWVLLLTRRAVDEVLNKSRGWIKWSALTGAVVGMATLADPRWTLPTGLLLLAYGIRRVWLFRDRTTIEGKRLVLMRMFRAGILCVVAGSMLAACLVLPLLEFVQLSTRAGLSPGELSGLALPLTEMVGVLIPFLSQPEWLAYIGVTVLCLSALGVLARAPGSVFWSAVVVGAWIFSFGDQTPLYTLFTALVPGASLLRIPPRMLFVASFGAAILAGYGADWILGIVSEQGVVKRARLLVIALMVTVILLTVAIWLITGSISRLLVGVGVLAAITTIWAFLSFTHYIPQKILVLGWIVLVLADLMWVDAQLIEVRTREEVLYERGELAGALSTESEHWRVFSPTYSIPYHSAVQVGLEMADGVNPMQLHSYQQYMAATIDFSPENYSVTLPPFPSGDPRVPWEGDLDLISLGRLNVLYIISEYPIETPGLLFERRLQGAYVYRNEWFMPRAWVESLPSDPMAEWRHIDELEWRPNNITIRAQGPGMLVLSEMVYPGWRVSVDGVEVEGRSTPNLLRSVELSEGGHEVVFKFQPWSVLVGCGLTLIAMVGLVLLWVRQ
jgi:hypothetical protein